MRCYFDTAYVVKCYLNEVDAREVRRLAKRAAGLFSSSWCIAEFGCTIHRQVRERLLAQEQAAEVRAHFLADVNGGVWVLYPVTDQLIIRVEAAVAALSPRAHLRAGDAVHLVTAREAGFSEIWTNDRHLLAAAPHFGLAGRSV